MQGKAKLAVTAGLGMAGIGAAVGLPGGATAQTGVTVRDVKVSIKCSLGTGQPVTLCRGTFKLTRGFNDKGRLKKTESNDRVNNGALFKGTLDGSKGELSISDDGVRLSHRRRDCRYATTYFVRGVTGGYEGFSGSYSKPTCVKLEFKSGSIIRSSEFSVQLTKRG